MQENQHQAPGQSLATQDSCHTVDKQQDMPGPGKTPEAWGNRQRAEEEGSNCSPAISFKERALICAAHPQ